MHHRTAAVAVLSVLILSLASLAQTLVWSEDFDGTTLNSANWEIMTGTGTTYGLPAGWGNNELEYYTGRPENLSVSGGYLHIVARAESYSGSNYTSARIRSQHKQDFKYGRMEARIKLPSTTGIWPAFWMMPTDSPYGGWASCGEIDIVESINVATTVYGTIHYGGSWPNNQSSGGSRQGGINYANDFHVYAVQWEPDTIRWYVDGVNYYTTTSATWFSSAAPSNDRAPFDSPFHFLLNVAVGGNWPGGPNGSSVFPQEMTVDYVRVYDLAPPSQTPFFTFALPIPGTIEAENYDNGGEGVAYHDCDGANNGGQYRAAEAVDLEACSEGGFNIGWMCGTEWTEYTVSIAAAGPYRVDARVASQSTGGAFKLQLDGADITGAMTVPVTGGWQNWATTSTTVDLPAGTHVLRFANGVSNTPQYNVHRFVFTALDLADINRDGAVNVADYNVMSDCFAGPEMDIPPASCSAVNFVRSDLDWDGDVDLGDYGVFQQHTD